MHGSIRGKIGLRLAAAIVMATVLPCGIAPASDMDDDPEVDEATFFAGLIQGARTTIDEYSEKTRRGKNLSDVTLGLFVSRLLGAFGTQDVEISRHLHENDRFIEAYLIQVFQYHPDDEIRFFEDQSAQSTTPRQRSLRLSAARALSLLKAIPDGKAPPAQQEQDRQDLLVVLAALNRELEPLAEAHPQ